MPALQIVDPPLDLESVNRDLNGASAIQILEWSAAEFGSGLVASSSFGAQSAVLLHLIHRVAPTTPIILIDTGYLFPETYRFAEELRARLALDLRVYAPGMTPAYQEAVFGRRWEGTDEDIEAYLHTNKVEPMQRALFDLQARAWISGVRANQTEHRASLDVVEMQDGRYKIHPILGWTNAEVDAYVLEHDLPIHPLVEHGYRSIGDWHSTLPTTPDMDPRDGRILGKKRECGLHLPLSPEQNKSLKSSGL